MPVKKKESTPRAIDWVKFGARVADETENMTWKPVAEGDSVSGKVVKAEEVTTRYGDKVVVELEGCDHFVSNGEEHDVGTSQRVVIWATPGLVTEFNDARVQLDDEVEITLDELVDTGKGNPFKSFAVEVSK